MEKEEVLVLISSFSEGAGRLGIYQSPKTRKNPVSQSVLDWNPPGHLETCSLGWPILFLPSPGSRSYATCGTARLQRHVSMEQECLLQSQVPQWLCNRAERDVDTLQWSSIANSLGSFCTCLLRPGNNPALVPIIPPKKVRGNGREFSIGMSHFFHHMEIHC